MSLSRVQLVVLISGPGKMDRLKTRVEKTNGLRFLGAQENRPGDSWSVSVAYRTKNQEGALKTTVSGVSLRTSPDSAADTIVLAAKAAAAPLGGLV